MIPESFVITQRNVIIMFHEKTIVEDYYVCKLCIHKKKL